MSSQLNNVRWVNTLRRTDPATEDCYFYISLVVLVVVWVDFSPILSWLLALPFVLNRAHQLTSPMRWSALKFRWESARYKARMKWEKSSSGTEAAETAKVFKGSVFLTSCFVMIGSFRCAYHLLECLCFLPNTRRAQNWFYGIFFEM